GASFNSVGTANSGAGNVLSGNGGRGVFVRDPGTSSNVISGNFIGTDATGTKILRNDLHGVSLALGASGTTVGGTSSAARNLVSGNGVIGVLIGDSANNVVQGNYIGTDFSGTTALPNQAGGVGIQQIDSATTNNLIGGPAAGARNIIAGNGGEGVDLYPCARNFIQGNSIGLGVTGAGLVNYGSGVYIEAGTNNLVGGASSGQSNLIAFNQAGAYSSGDGVTIQSG